MPGDLERATTNKDNQRLTADHDEEDADEEQVTLDTLQNVELVVQTAVVQRVEDLHPDEGVEDHGLQLCHLLFSAVTEDLRTRKVENKSNDELVNCLSNDHLPHVDRDKRRGLGIRLAVKDLACRRISCQSKSSHGVHDQVNPKKLNCGEDRLLAVGRHSSDESEKDRSNVHRDLELEEFPDCVVDSTTPHESLDNGTEVVVHENDVGSLLRDFGTSNVHRKANVGGLQSRSIVGTVTSHGNSFSHLLKTSDQDTLVFWRRARKDLQLGNDFALFVLAHLSEFGAFHSEATRREDATFFRNCLCSVDVVAGDHAGEHSSHDAICDRFRDTFA